MLYLYRQMLLSVRKFEQLLKEQGTQTAKYLLLVKCTTQCVIKSVDFLYTFPLMLRKSPTINNIKPYVLSLYLHSRINPKFRINSCSLYNNWVWEIVTGPRRAKSVTTRCFFCNHLNRGWCLSRTRLTPINMILKHVLMNAICRALLQCNTIRAKNKLTNQ